MRIAVLSDIHGNRIGLDAVLDDLARDRVDQMVCLGDVAANGPQPRQVLDRLREVGCTVIRGNTDEWFLDLHAFEPNSDKERRLMDMMQWARAQLSAADIEYIESFEPTVAVDLGGGQSLLAFHGSPHSNIHIVSAMTPDEELARLLSGCHATVMACGHTHAQLLRRFQDMVIFNPGSVGMALERGLRPEQVWNPPRAEYATITAENGRLSIDLRRVPYNLDKLVQAVREGGMAQADWWLKDHH